MLFQLFQALIYGLIQGICEFLPISSTAHLIIVPYFFNWQDPGLSFDVLLHLGTLIAIILFFARDWVKIISNFLKRKSNLFGYLLLAAIPGAILGALFESKIETAFRDVLLIATALFIFSFVMYIADRWIKHQDEIQNMNWWKSLLIGIAQSLALIPGVSRAGATMTMGLFLGLKRESAARFSFLAATPIMLGATLFKIRQLFETPNGQIFNGFGLLPAIFGFVIALFSGYLAIKYLLKYLSHGNFLPFVIYRIVLAVLIVIFYLLIK